MMRYRFKHLGWGIFVAVGALYFGVGFIFDRWYEQLAIGFLLGAFLAAPDYHPRLLQSAGLVRGALTSILEPISRRHSLYHEAVELGVEPSVLKPSMHEIEEAQAAGKILRRHMALEQLSTSSTAMHKDYLWDGD